MFCLFYILLELLDVYLEEQHSKLQNISFLAHIPAELSMISNTACTRGNCQENPTFPILITSTLPVMIPLFA